MITASHSVTPMLRLVLEWDEVPSADTYVVKLLQAGSEDTVTETTTSTLYRVSQPLRNATWYFFQVTALDASEAELDASAIVPFYVNAQVGTAAVLRQAVYDVLFDAGLSLVDDRKFRPRAWGKTAAPSSGLPAIEIAMPALQSIEPETDITQVHTYTVPIKLILTDDRKDPDNDSGAWLFFEIVQSAIDTSEGLRLTNWGVLPELWQWQATLNQEGTRSKSSEIDAVLQIPMKKRTGCVMFPQPDTLPEQPETPLTL